MIRTIIFLVALLIGAQSYGQEKSVTALLDEVKATIKKRKFKWDQSIFTDKGWQIHGKSIQGYPLIYWSCGNKDSTNTSLVLSAVHGDEVAPVYYGFRLVEWLKAHPEICEKRFITIAPIVNPDGFFRYNDGTRTNYNKVDLNRNFDTPDWNSHAHALWKTKGNSQRRYYPGDKAASEPETIFQKWLIDEFKPSKVLSVHAPLNLLDYDGPQTPEVALFSKNYIDSCEALKNAMEKATPVLKAFPYGSFPGSLGNYAGKQRGIPTFTVEFPTVTPVDAPHYFGELERGTRLFFEYELSGNRLKTAAAN